MLLGLAGTLLGLCRGEPDGRREYEQSDQHDARYSEGHPGSVFTGHDDSFIVAAVRLEPAMSHPERLGCGGEMGSGNRHPNSLSPRFWRQCVNKVRFSRI